MPDHVLDNLENVASMWNMDYGMHCAEGKTETRIVRRDGDNYVVSIYIERKGYGHPKGYRAWKRDRTFDCFKLAYRFADAA